jgi:hypothetical protein
MQTDTLVHTQISLFSSHCLFARLRLGAALTGDAVAAAGGSAAPPDIYDGFRHLCAIEMTTYVLLRTLSGGGEVRSYGGRVTAPDQVFLDGLIGDQPDSTSEYKNISLASKTSKINLIYSKYMLNIEPFTANHLLSQACDMFTCEPEHTCHRCSTTWKEFLSTVTFPSNQVYHPEAA